MDRFSWKLQYGTRALLGAILVAGCACALFLGIRERRGEHLEPQVANARLHIRLDVPLSAQDVSFASSLGMAACDFKIDEQGFVKWCADQGGVPAEIHSDNLRVFRYANESERQLSHIVRDGLECTMGTKSKMWALYDRKTGEASIHIAK
jgi:hypothetical protein